MTDTKSNRNKAVDPAGGEPLRLLVVGDWFVDENWIVTTESDPTSAHIGRRQYRSRVEETDAQILSLCGAGGVASLFHGLARAPSISDGPPIEIYGLGLWDIRDTPFLGSLFDQEPIPGQTPLTLAGMELLRSIDPALTAASVGKKPIPSPPAAIPSRHLSRDCLRCPDEPCQRLRSIAKPGSGTWRVVRVYQRIGHQAPELLNRYDWEVRKSAFPDQQDFQILANELKQGPTIHVVIAVEHNKGALSKELVNCLKEAFPEARWYARCKNPSVDWLALMRSQLKLLVVGPMGLELTRDPWFYGKHLSQEAIQRLMTLAWGEAHPAIDPPKSDPQNPKLIAPPSEENPASLPPGPVVVAHHKDNRVAALNPATGNLLVTTSYPSPLPIRVGRTTNVFAALVAGLEKLIPPANAGDLTDPFAPLLRLALDSAQQWCQEIEDILKMEKIIKNTPLQVNFRRRFSTALAAAASATTVFKLGEMRLWKEDQSWHDALNPESTGHLPSTTTGAKFQVWRGWSAVDGFIALEASRRAAIGQLIKEVGQYRRIPTPAHSFSTLIIARPGQGKSFMARRLAAMLDLPIAEFNITYLASINDLIACFDIIASRQNEEPIRPLVVFWDEINAPLANEFTYSYFLGPLWDGVYRRGGTIIRLQPAIWIFAGTETPQENTRRMNKASDFLSRLNGPVLDFRVADPAATRLERLYTAVALIRRIHPEVQYISVGLLEFLKKAQPFYDIRSLELLVSRMRHVRHGQIGLDNLPETQDLVLLIHQDDNLIQWLGTQTKKEKTQSTFVFIYDTPPPRQAGTYVP